MVVRIAETTKIYRNMQVMALTALIVIVQVILKAIVTNLKNKSNRNSGTSNNDGQGHRIFNSKDVAFTTIAMKK
jgi:ABC-type amino acid transport system permease subunit